MNPYLFLGIFFLLLFVAFCASETKGNGTED